MSENTNESVVEVNTDAARTKLARHKTKIKVAALSLAGAALFVAGRKSKNVDVDIDYNDDSSAQD